MYIPAYQRSLQSGELEQKARSLHQQLSSCDLCPRNCGVNRISGEVGLCGTGGNAWVSSYGPHFGEEDPLRGWQGSGTIFFSGCNLNCLYCQNADISQQIVGIEVSTQELAEIMLELEYKGCHNINFVSPSHVVPQIVQAVFLAALEDLSIPLVYNSGGYDSLRTLRQLDGIIDIYMPDMKYSDDMTASDLSGIPSYPDINKKAVLEMHRQVGDLKVSDRGIALRGLLIRHLILPSGLAGSGKILEFIAGQISLDTYLNIMDQYRPSYRASSIQEINRRVEENELNEVIEIAHSLGLLRLDKRY